MDMADYVKEFRAIQKTQKFRVATSLAQTPLTYIYNIHIFLPKRSLHILPNT